MFVPCTCGTGGQNTGVPTCVQVIDRDSMLIFVNTFDNAGVRNSIKKTDFVAGVLPDAFIEAKINELDPSKRWYVTPKVNNVTDVRSEPVTFDVDGIPKIVDQGTRTFVGSFYDKLGSPVFAGVLNSFECIDMSYFGISVGGEIVGIDNDTEMLPIDIETGTLLATVVRKTKTELNAVALTFSVHELVRDENLIQIGVAAIAPNMLLKRGLLQVTGEALASPAITATTARLDFHFVYGEFPELNAVEGVLAADLSSDLGVTPSSIFNNSTSTQVLVSSLTPVVGEPGQYDMVNAAGPVSTNIMQVAFFKAGFELTVFTYVIP